jgi:hypothetical protein
MWPVELGANLMRLAAGCPNFVGDLRDGRFDGAWHPELRDGVPFQRSERCKSPIQSAA